MFDVNSPDFDYYYKKSKLIVKRWEEDFRAQHGRNATKADIKASSQSVRYYYRKYYQLKTKLMEETILGSQNTKDNAVSRCKSDNVLKEHTNIIEEKSPAVNKSNGDIISKNLKENDNNQDVQGSKNDLKTWGFHLNKAKSSPFECEMSGLLNCSVSEKLFEGSKFKKRNPRKSLKENKSNTSLTSKALESNQTPLKTVATHVPTTPLDAFSSVYSFQTDFSPCPDTHDESAVAIPFSVENDCSPKIKALITSETELSPFFKSDKCKIISEEKTIQNNPTSLIHAVTTERKKDLLPARKLDAGWIERCNDAVSEQILSHDSGFQSRESSSIGFSDSKEDIRSDDSDEDDIIADSDNETCDSTTKLSFLPMKRKAQDISDVTSSVASTNTGCLSPEDMEEACEQPMKKVKLDSYTVPEKLYGKKLVAQAKKAKLEKKMMSGTLNDNYVKINIKKKVYCRGKKNFNYSKRKKQQWKKLKTELENAEGGAIQTCYKCGEAGHFARYCQKSMTKLLSEEEDVEEESSLPTLEEAEEMAREKVNHKKKHVLIPECQDEPEKTSSKVDPVFSLKDDQTLIETPEEVFDALRKFGHSRFRPGQEEAIMRILSGLSTLVTIATGGGKSLCYQLPAYLYATRSKCLTLVVSPLVSLMEDQVSGSSTFFKLGCLHTNQTTKQRQSVIDDAKNGKLYALLVSPEAVFTCDSSSGLYATLKSLPPIAFACIDEVHCVSQWSHNFRPCYLMLTEILKEKFGVKTILGLTATATKTTISGITRELGITDPNGVIKDIPLPDNLCLSISRDENKDKALLELLQGPRFKDANAILIYCTKRDECERLAVLIRTLHNDYSNPLASAKKRLSWNAESYHAGMSSARRKQVQKAFMKGNLRIVVATIAFGMGINKQDIRGIIHYNMPRDFESYVQEVGRAGRDGMQAHCHLFLDTKGKDLSELRRHIYSNSVDRHVLRKLLQRVFIECKCKETGKSCPGHEVAFDCNDTIQTLDIPEENIHTLLLYLELHPKKLIKVLAPGFINSKIQSYCGMKAITTAAKKCPPLAVACAMNPSTFSNGNSSLVINVIDLANAISWESGVVKSQLKNVEWSQAKDGKWKKSGIVIEFFGLGFRVLARGDMTPQELDEALNYLIERVETQEKRSSVQLDIIFSALTHFSSKFEECLADYDKDKSNGLKDVIRKYFETEELSGDVQLRTLQMDDFDEDEVACDVRALICSYRDNSFNGRAVARIFHGIQSPNYPASTWYKCRHWRQHIDKDFNRIRCIATREILRYK